MSKEYDYLFKLVIVGNSGVGKSSLLMRYSDDTFNDTYLATIGVDFKFKTVSLDGKKIKMQIWDTAGQERFRTITSAYYKGADAIVMVYDCSHHPSFDDIDNFWINEVESYADKDVEILLLGNKCDLKSEKAVEERTAKDYGQKKNMEFFEVSAKTADSVHEAFNVVARKLIEKKKAKIREKMNKSGAAAGGTTTTGSGNNSRSSITTEEESKVKLGGNNPQEEQGFLDRLKQNSCCQ
jgi:Ras-related protein Rab-1A